MRLAVAARGSSRDASGSIELGREGEWAERGNLCITGLVYIQGKRCLRCRLLLPRVITSTAAALANHPCCQRLPQLLGSPPEASPPSLGAPAGGNRKRARSNTVIVQGQLDPCSEDSGASPVRRP